MADGNRRDADDNRAARTETKYNVRMAVNKLSEAELKSEIQQLPHWAVKHEKLHREFAFKDFVHAFGFMATAAMIIEKMNHHPEWCNVYGKVTVDLTTHDAGGITRKDVELAGKLDAIAAKLLA